MDKQPTRRTLAGTAVWHGHAETAGLFLVMAASAWTYRGAFRCFFIQDDFAWLVIARFHTVGEYAECFFRFNPAGTYRPLSQETFFWLGQRIFGMWPPGFHLISITAHLLAVLLLYVLLRRFVSILPALMGACFYALHGAHLTSLFWISAFPEPLAMVFSLAAMLAFIRFDRHRDGRAYALSLVAMLLGIMSKESVLSLPLILAAYSLLLGKSRLLWTIPFFVISGGYALLRLLGRVPLAPYDLSLGPRTLDSLCSYLSWMAGFSTSLVQTGPHWNLPGSYRWIAAGFALLLVLLCLIAHNRRVAAFAVIWMVSALQPVLYFSDHIYPYYLAPALAALSLLIAAALPPLRDPAARKRWLPGFLVAGVTLGLSLVTIHLDGEWWIRRTDARRAFVERILAIDRQMPKDGTAYIVGLKQDEFENLENGSVFAACDIPPHRILFLLPEFDSDLRPRLQRLARSGEMSRSYCFLFSSDGVMDRTAAFRNDPESLFDRKPVRFVETPGVRFEASPAVIRRGKDTMVLRLFNLEARAVDLLYSIDGQLMPPILRWGLDARHAAEIFVGVTTAEGNYRFLALRPSDSPETGWIKIDARVSVR